jgi:hypothetical protein
MKLALVGGLFDDKGGRPSGYVRCLSEKLRAPGIFCNGGNWTTLEDLIDDGFADAEAVLWFADVSNDRPKLAGLIKARWPKLLLVTSKRNLDGAYSLSELLGRALKVKANLLVELTGERSRVEATVLDPLGSAFCMKETSVSAVAFVLLRRLERLQRFSRVPSKCVGPRIEPPDEGTFYELVKAQAERFHAIIHGVGHERMMGNASFRCARGFPSIRYNDLAFVSRRDVDKRYIGPEAFVAVELSPGDSVRYFGPDKPSVDTPIQVQLYRSYPRVRYMLHSHTYIDGAPMTAEPIPCGAIEEAHAIFSVVPDTDAADFAVNLRGHGSIVLASKLDTLRDQPWCPRPVPELFPS